MPKGCSLLWANNAIFCANILGLYVEISDPSTIIFPSLTGNSRVKLFNKVDLPLPLGPIKLVTFPSGILIDIFSITCLFK